MNEQNVHYSLMSEMSNELYSLLMLRRPYLIINYGIGTNITVKVLNNNVIYYKL